MNLIKPKFWDYKNPNFIAYILYPISFFIFLINNLFRKLKQTEFKIKTICIGNIYIGGTGKTTLAIELSKLLKKKYKIVFIKKNYPSHIDEINLLKKKGPVIVENDRLKALKNAVRRNFKIALLDDGLQQKNIKYSLKIVCFNSKEGFGNGFLLPSGPLRESPEELKKYDIAFLNGETRNRKLYTKIKSINNNIIVFEAKYKPVNLKKLNRKKNYLMFCGIGNPNEFEKTLLKYKFRIKKKIIYPDHYQILNDELNKIKEIAKEKNLNIITTEKDYCRLNKNQKKNINVLKIKLKINNLHRIRKILDAFNEKN